jgi:hypothetical protein
MRILLTAFGSRGDVHPLLALANALQTAGHQPVVTGPPDFVPDALDIGVPYVPHGPPAQAFLKANQSELGTNPVRMVRVVRRNVSEHIDAQFAAVGKLARDTDMVLAAGLMWASSSVAEAHGLAYRYVAYTPEVVASRYHAPPLCPWQNLPQALNRLAWLGFERLVDWLVLPSVNRNRVELGLAQLARITPHLLRQRASSMKKPIEQRVEHHDPLAGLALDARASGRSAAEVGAATAHP